ncbi:MAG TPA: hypothetical protein VF062_13235 [Candidatus Limnocylindrales bacterium]
MKVYLGIGAAVLTVLALVSVYSFVSTRFFTPQRTVTGYLDALVAGDADEAMSYLLPVGEGEGTGSEWRMLLTSEVLNHEGYREPANIVVGEVTGEEDVRVVPVSFEIDGAEHAMEFTVRRSEAKTLGLFRGWLIDGGLAPLEIFAPAAAPVTVNGVTMPPESGGFLAFPGGYRVSVVDNPLLQGRDVTAVAVGGGNPVQLTVTLKDSARAEVEAQVKSFVDECAKSTDLEPTGCPFAAFAIEPIANVKWTVTTYPTLNLTVNPQTGTVNVTTTRSGRADVTGTYSSDGTAYNRSDTFSVSGTAVVADGKVRLNRR